MLKLPLSWKALIVYHRIENIICEVVYKNLCSRLGIDNIKLNITVLEEQDFPENRPVVSLSNGVNFKWALLWC